LHRAGAGHDLWCVLSPEDVDMAVHHPPVISLLLVSSHGFQGEPTMTYKPMLLVHKSSIVKSMTKWQY